MRALSTPIPLPILAALLAGLAGCTSDADVPPLGDYTTWKRLDVTGDAPGHTNSYRIIYANEIAANPAQGLFLGYPEGSVLVKEVRDNDSGAPGDLRYLAVMRKVRPVTRALDDEGGWMFTETDGPNGSEQSFGFCWGRCHAAAPYNGAWYDYRR
jgi:hypothetical protein